MTATHHEAQGAGGMTGLPFMPFPFLNPWNWSAMTPSREVAAGMFMLRVSLEGWRNVADAWQSSLREQQDAMLDALARNVDHALVEPNQDAPQARPRSRRS